MSELYRNAVCLAPMVRAGTPPLRLLAVRYGADLVYSEEIIDKRIIATTRIENHVLNTVDYVSNNGDSVVFRTFAEEKGKIVFQIGTADAQLALKAAQKVAQDVAAIDINMGCPKHFSIQGGMGAALLQKQDVACEIVRTLSQHLSIPVSAKIRLFDDPQATIAFAKALQDAGAVAIGLHARHVSERPTDKAHWDALAPVVAALSVPVLVNGDIYTREDLAKLRELSGASSFLIARGALSNASIFRKDGMLPYTDAVKAYLLAAAETDNVFQNTKYTVSRMLPSKCDEGADDATVTVADIGVAKSNEHMYSLWGLEGEYARYQELFRARAEALQANAPPRPMGLEHVHDDAHVLERQFYCNLCSLQLLSDKDVALHVKGKKHRNKMRALAAARRMELQAPDMPIVTNGERNGAASDLAATTSTDTEPSAKRAKVDESSGRTSPTDSGESIAAEAAAADIR